MPEQLANALREAVTRSNSPGAVAYVGDRTEMHFHGAFGARQLVPESHPAEKSTPYDLASLTKMVATTTAVLLLREDGKIDLDAPVSKYVPIPEFGRFTVRHCMTHTAGLPPGLPNPNGVHSLNEAMQRCARLELRWPPGSRRMYSDLSYIILAKVVELVARDSLDAYCAKRIFRPLDMTHTTFNPPKTWRGTCAATEKCPDRGGVLVGVVHDETAYALGGVSGHAGLFATADDLARFCRAMVNGKLLSEKTIQEMSKLGQVPSYPWQGLGWKVDGWSSGGEGFLPARTSIGHTGWTGTSIWMDLEKGLFVILLSNTCHPSRNTHDTALLRRRFHAEVAEAFYPNRSNTHSGLDRVVHDEFEKLKGKRIALLTHHAAVDQLGRPILEVLALEPKVQVKIAYGPEHGFRGNAEAGDHIASERATIPIVSLYGDRKRPSKEELKQIDLFVVDLQDVGARFYTYIATMRECMIACAEAGKPVLVLDRPNPAGGVVIEGPVAREVRGLTCCARIPGRHAMTLGEVALLFAKDLPAKIDVSLVECDGWPRHLLFGRCALPWIPPSPNIPDAETAMLYTGMCLFECTNLNEGRGTDTPFQVIGAPWLNAKAVIESLAPEEYAGCTLETVMYVPKAIPGKASAPPYRDKMCRGIRVRVKEPERVRTFTLAVALCSAIQRHHAKAFSMDSGFDTLAGCPEVRDSIRRGVPALEIVQRYAAELEAFDRSRPRRYAKTHDGEVAKG